MECIPFTYVVADSNGLGYTVVAAIKRDCLFKYFESDGSLHSDLAALERHILEIGAVVQRKVRENRATSVTVTIDDFVHMQP